MAVGTLTIVLPTTVPVTVTWTRAARGGQPAVSALAATDGGVPVSWPQTFSRTTPSTSAFNGGTAYRQDSAHPAPTVGTLAATAYIPMLIGIP